VADVFGFDATGNKVTVPEKDAQELIDRGGRVATPEEIAKAKLESEYEAQSTGMKVAQAVLGGSIGPKTEAIHEGLGGAFTGGINQALTKTVLDEIKPGAGKQYAQHIDDLRTGESEAYTAGEVGGIAAQIAVGGAFGGGGAASLLGRLAPGAEAAISRGAGTLAARGALGRAAVTGIQMGGRGAAETMLASGINQISEDILHDRELGGEKVFAAMGHGALMGGAFGFGLGAAGSLIASGARSAVSGIAGRAAAAGEKAAEGAERVAGAAKEVAREAAEATAPRARTLADAARDVAKPRGARVGVEPVGKGMPKVGEEVAEAAAAGEGAAASGAKKAASHADGAPTSLGDIAGEAGGTSGNKTRNLGYEWVWGAVNPTVKYTKDMARQGLTKSELGEVMVRYGIFEPEKGFIRGAILEASADELLAKTEKAIATEAGPRVGRLTEAGASSVVTHADLESTVGKLVEEYKGKLGHETLARQLERLKGSLYRNLGVADGQASTTVENLLAQRRYLDDILIDGKATVSPRTAAEVKQNFRNAIESVVMGKLDEAAKAAGNPGLRAELRQAKWDYKRLNYIKEALVESGERYAGAQKSDLRFLESVGKSVATGALYGGPKGAIVGGAVAAGKHVLSERARALGGMLLLKVSDMGSIMTTIRSFDDQAVKAARGVLFPAAKKTEKAVESAADRAARRQARADVIEAVTSPSSAARMKVSQVRQQANDIVANVIEMRARPQQFLQKLTEGTSAMTRAAPETAQAFTSAALRGTMILSQIVPQRQPSDPLNPKSGMLLTDLEAARIVRTAEYVNRPIKFFEDVEVGKVTPEGVAVAKVLMPKAYAEFQATMMNTIAQHFARGKTIPYAQRLKIGVLLGIPADASLRPERMKLLQSNVSEPLPASSGPGPSNNSPVNLPIQQSAFDRLTENGPGRR